MAFTPFVDTDRPTMANFNEKFQEAITDAIAGGIAGAPKIETGSYVGTGTYGSGNPNTLTLPFVPKTIEFIGAEGGTYNNYQGTDPYPVIVAADYLTDEYQYVVIYDSGKANDFQYMKLDGTTLSWYYGKSAAGQLNTSGHKYYYKITG